MRVRSPAGPRVNVGQFNAVNWATQVFNSRSNIMKLYIGTAVVFCAIFLLPILLESRKGKSR